MVEIVSYELLSMRRMSYDMTYLSRYVASCFSSPSDGLQSLPSTCFSCRNVANTIPSRARGWEWRRTDSASLGMSASLYT